MHVEGELDLADALDLDHALAHGAEELAGLGCAGSLDVRRALAAGALARGELTLHLTTHPDTDTSHTDDTHESSRTTAPAGTSEPAQAPAPGSSRRPRGRELTLYAHLHPDPVTGRAGPLAGLDNTRTAVLAGQVRDLIVESMLTDQSRSPAASASASSRACGIRSQVPSLLNRLCRFHTVCQGRTLWADHARRSRCGTGR